jgi:segregation and condensation protein B
LLLIACRPYSFGMSQRQRVDTASSQLTSPDSSPPDDAEVSLDELSRAYAALLAKSEPVSPGVGTADDDRSATDNDASFEVTPRSILEAILFIGHPAGEPLTSERIAGLMRGVQPAEIDALVEALNGDYAAAAAPYQIVRIDAGYQMVLRPQFGPLRDVFYGRIREARLSQAAIDVLAIVAYHQPISADDIDRLRSKPSGAIVAQLVRRELLTVVRPPERKAKSQYQTTSRFLDLFGLSDLKELPTRLELEREP